MFDHIIAGLRPGPNQTIVESGGLADDHGLQLHARPLCEMIYIDIDPKALIRVGRSFSRKQAGEFQTSTDFALG
jgi:hypothetical protein